MHVPLIYKDASSFGFDLGSRTIKIVQLAASGRKVRLVGYGFCDFPAEALVEGIISDPKLIADRMRSLIQKPLGGRINARRVTIALPASKIFIRTLQLPPMNDNDLEQAIRFEAEQYVPVPINDLYIDYEKIKPEPKAEHTDVLMVAAPRAIVDSYVKLFDYLDLEIDSIETTLASITRAMMAATEVTKTSMVIDFGSRSADLAIYNQVVRLTGSIAVGGDDLTDALVKGLGISADQANEIKYKFGVGSSGLQAKIMEAVEPKLAQMVAEIKKVTKYYKERSDNQEEVTNVTLTGGSASMPGLIDYLYQATELPLVIGDPWLKLELGHLSKPAKLEAPMYTTAIGLALRGQVK